MAGLKGLGGGGSGDSYGSYFEYQKAPTVGTTYQVTPKKGVGGFTTAAQRQVVGTGFGKLKAAPNKVNFFEEMMKGYDARSQELTNKLESIYDKYEETAKNYEVDLSGFDDVKSRINDASGGYEGAIAEYKAQMAPVLESFNADIDSLADWGQGYQSYIDEIAPRFNALELEKDPSARRKEYMGNVASQYDAAEAAMARSMVSQGLNPYSNTGATRQFKLDRAGSMAGAATQAYKDWREQYNKDVLRDQAAAAQYAGLKRSAGDAYRDVMDARYKGGQLIGDIYGKELQGLSADQQAKIAAQRLYLDTEKARQEAARYPQESLLAAQQARAAGYEGLAGLNEARRSQALQLEQAKQATNAQMDLARSQLSAGLDPQWHSVSPYIAGRKI